jgi:hypothetical protein
MLRILNEGHRLEKPDNCPDPVYNLVKILLDIIEQVVLNKLSLLSKIDLLNPQTLQLD